MDANSLCPGGSGKKIKYCPCCQDIANDILKISRMLDGEQRVAALEHIARLPAAAQQRPSVLSLKAAAQTGLEQYDEAETTLQTFLETHPQNPVALAYATMVEINQKNTRAAIDRLQQALFVCDQHMPADVYHAIGVVAQVLLSTGRIYAARAHWSLQAGLSGEQDKTPIMALAKLDRDTRLPLTHKNDPTLQVECPDDAPYKADFDAAMKLAARGAWRAAADVLVKTVVTHGRVPLLWRNLATLRMYLADDRAAADALSRYASLDIPEHDRLEAEVFSTVLRSEELRDEDDVISVTYEVREFDRLLEKLLSDSRTPTMPVDPRHLAREGQPPPRGVYWVIDRTAPAGGADLKLEDVPRALGHIALFGRESDREARIEAIVVRPQESQVHAVLAEALGECLGSRVSEEVVGKQRILERMLNEQWRLPPDTPEDVQRRLMDEQRRQALLEKWPSLPMKLFGGETPAQAAKSSHNHARLGAAVLMMELGDQRPAPKEYDELRAKLGLPAESDLDPAKIDFTQLSVLHLHRLNPAQLDQDQLLSCYEHAVAARANRAIRRLGEALLATPCGELIEHEEVYADFAETAVEPDEANRCLEMACVEAEKHGHSSAPHLLRLLGLNLSIADGAAAQQILERLKPYLHEEEVAQSAYAILAQFGVIDPYGRPRGEMGAGRGEQRLDISAGGPAPASSGLWTPGSESAAPAGERKSSLILPD